MFEPLPKTRLFVSEDLAPSSGLTLAGKPAHYLLNVLRMTAGDRVAVFNGRDGEWLAVIATAGRGRCELSLELQVRAQRAEPGPWLLFAPIKKTGVDFIVEKATELGAARLWPVLTERTQSARVNLDRLQARAIEAAEQCRRLTVPAIAEPVALAALPEHWPSDRRLVVLDERGTAPPLAAVIEDLARLQPASLSGFTVGPEGGFAASELDALATLPFVSAASLGPRILRAETAALAALACWQAVAGDFARARSQ